MTRMMFNFWTSWSRRRTSSSCHALMCSSRIRTTTIWLTLWNAFWRNLSRWVCTGAPWLPLASTITTTHGRGSLGRPSIRPIWTLASRLCRRARPVWDTNSPTSQNGKLNKTRQLVPPATTLYFRVWQVSLISRTSLKSLHQAIIVNRWSVLMALLVEADVHRPV